MSPAIIYTGIFILAQAAQSPPTPQAVVRLAAVAVEGDSVAAVAQRWSSSLAQDSADVAALLGLAAIAQFTYQKAQADSLYSRLSSYSGPGLERWALMGRITQAQGLIATGSLTQADSLLAVSAEEASALEEPAAEALALIHLARIRARTAGPAASLQLLGRAEELIPEDDPSLLGHFRCAEAHVLAFQGDSLAVERSEAGQALARRVGDLRLEAQCLSVVGQFESFRGHSAAAIATYARVAELTRRAGDRASLAAAHHWRGFLLRTRGELGEAREEAMRAIQEGEASGNTIAEAWSLLTLAQISAALSDGASGTRYIRRSIELHEANGDQLGLATALIAEGDLAFIRGDWPEAERAYARGVAWAQDFGDPHRLAWSYSKLANVARRTGDFEKAAEALQLSRSTAQGAGMAGWVYLIRYDIGALALERGRLDDADSILRTHLSELPPTDHLTRYITRARLAELFAARGQIERAETELSSATADLDSWRATLSEADLRLLVFQYGADPADPDVGIASIVSALAEDGRADSAFAFVEKRRARELLDNVVRARALQTREPDVQVGSDGPSAGAAPLSLDEVRAAIPDEHSAILAFVTGRGREPTTLFVVSKGHTATYRLTPIDSLAEMAIRFTTLVEGGGAPPALAQGLGEALLGRAIEDLPPTISRLLIVPDDVLHRVPFDALQLDDGGRLVERFAVSLIPSASVAVHLWEREQRSGEVALLALADPEFSQDSPSDRTAETDVLLPAFDEAGGLPRLSASAREARAAARFAAHSVVRLRDQASEAFVKREPLAPYHIVHFATHALVDERTLTRTALALSPGDGEDGFVTVADLAGLQLDADLVVLSACNTAGGVVIGGEGIGGLTAPLLQAGARAIVASRWPIGDRATARLVEEFYLFQAEGMAVGDALHATKLAALRRGEPSAVWATFTVIGDPFVLLELQRPRSRLWWLLAVGLVLALAYLAWTWKRRAAARS